MKIFDAIKLGIGFYIGFELASSLNDILGETYKVLKERVEKGY